MSDGEWRTPSKIDDALKDRGCYTTAYMEKLRQLRQAKHGGFILDHKAKPGRAPGSQAEIYRLVPPATPVQSAPREPEDLGALQGEADLSPVAIPRAPAHAMTDYGAILREIDGRDLHGQAEDR